MGAKGGARKASEKWREGEPAPSRLLPEVRALARSFPAWFYRKTRSPGPRSGLRGRRRGTPAALKPKPAGTVECSASSSRMTTSDTLIGQALAGAGPGGLRRGWEASWEAERPGVGSAATTSAPLPPPGGAAPLTTLRATTASTSASRPPSATRWVPPAWTGVRCDWLGWQARGCRGGVELDPSGRDFEEIGKEGRRGRCRHSFHPTLGRSVGLRPARAKLPGRPRLGAPQLTARGASPLREVCALPEAPALGGGLLPPWVVLDC